VCIILVLSLYGYHAVKMVVEVLPDGGALLLNSRVCVCVCVCACVVCVCAFVSCVVCAAPVLVTI
jgi:hypothetical protein